MFGNMQEKQAEMQKKLADIKVEAEAGDGVVKVTASANRQINDIKIDPNFKYSDIEELEDLVLIAVNRAIGKAAEIEQQEAQKMLNDMLPPGLGGLGNLFGM
jgi:DNA-binding YbaB/EbfC family protein